MKGWVVEIAKKTFRPYYKGSSKLIERYVFFLVMRVKDLLTLTVSSALLDASQTHRETLANELKRAGKVVIDVPNLGNIEVASEFITIERRTKTENIREYIPSIIEPSFGIGRLLSAVCEHKFWTRADDGGDEARCVRFFLAISIPQGTILC